MVLVCGQGDAQRRPNILVDAAGDASGGGGLWWSPQYPDFVPSKHHQGKALADYWRRKGADVEELPGTPEQLSGHDMVVLVRGRLSTPAPEQEIAAYREYVASGGKLLLLSDFLMPNEGNSLAESFGVQLTGISRGENLVERFVPHPITRNVGPFNYGRVRPFDKRGGGGSGVTSVTGDNVTLLAHLSQRTYLDLNFNQLQDAEEPAGAAVLGVIEHGLGVVVFVADSDTMLTVPQPLTENIYDFLMSYKPTKAGVGGR
jgi:hypothetical protein